jgi:hypothetical protein
VQMYMKIFNFHRRHMNFPENRGGIDTDIYV